MPPPAASSSSAGNSRRTSSQEEAAAAAAAAAASQQQQQQQQPEQGEVIPLQREGVQVAALRSMSDTRIAKFNRLLEAQVHAGQVQVQAGVYAGGWEGGVLGHACSCCWFCRLPPAACCLLSNQYPPAVRGGGCCC